ncbi:MAG TPA: thioredoxin family protein [Acidobacteriota bacterium]
MRRIGTCWAALLLFSLSASASVLVLKSGERIEEVAFVAQSGPNLKVMLRSGGIKLVPLEQLDLDATSRANGRGSTAPPDSSARIAANGSIAWSRSYDEALRSAAGSSKPVVLFVYTKWCGYCRKMDREVFANDRVVDQSQNFVYLRLDAEDGGEGTETARRYGVRSFPASFILDAQGAVLGRIPGFIEAPRWLRTLEQFRS